MTVPTQNWATEIRRLAAGLEQLEALATPFGVPPVDRAEWRQLLRHKLIPQTNGEPWLVAAVVGGTNIGKSVVFNHLAGEDASAVSPMAAGTKHPVCLTPPGFADRHLLGRLFEGFELRPWQASADALEENPQHLLFWREGRHVPPRLLVLDTPDVDSDAVVNWQRADIVRQSADVLLAVLTQQKYNDAAVKQFFRHAAEADKPVVVVFNQCDLQLDRDFWPQWLATFVDETGACPERVYVAPYDRRAAQSGQLPFFSVGTDGRTPPDQPSVLRDDLAALHFDTLKVRALRGALRRVVDRHSGAASYLNQVRWRGRDFGLALDALQKIERAPIEWPRLPTSVLMGEMHAWWDGQRRGLVRGIHGFYRSVGQAILSPMGKLRDQLFGPRPDQLKEFTQREWEAVGKGVEAMLAELERLAEVGNEILQPRLQARLGGASRADLLEDVRRAHAELLPVDDAFRQLLHDELARFTTQHPGWLRVVRSVDEFAAVVRPVFSVLLAATGVGLAGPDVLVTVAGQSVAEAATAAAVYGGGEAAVGAAGTGIQHAAAHFFLTVQTKYVEQRASWLCQWLRRRLLDDLLEELDRGSALMANPVIAQVEASLAALREISQDDGAGQPTAQTPRPGPPVAE